jgi:molybdopterin-containing oxidoreductase family iron-sulfur binding subunit
MKAVRSEVDWAELRRRLESGEGRDPWRSLAALAEGQALQERLQREFPEGASEWTDPVSRRRFLTLMGASLSLAGLNGCLRQPSETIVPYVRAPEEMIPGKPLFFATTLLSGGFGIGVLVESHLGRPLKIEGNPEHPGSGGALDSQTQAAILGLYDPDRSQVVQNGGRISTWDVFLTQLSEALQVERARRGSGLRILTETVTSPTLARQLERCLESLPEARWHQYEPIHRDNVIEGSRLAFGTAVDSVYRFDRADVILSLDADFLASGPGHLAYARQYASKRRTPSQGMNRLYVVEASPSVSGSMADHRFALRCSAIETVARALASRLGLIPPPGPEAPNWLEPIARDLLAHKGSSAVIVGESQPPVVHALAHAMNEVLGNLGSTVHLIEPVAARPSVQTESLRELARDLDAGAVDLLLVLGGNPVYQAPADLGFKDALSRAKLRVHLGLYDDETAELSHWHLPQAHPLESWSDARAYEGTVSLGQPLIAPLYQGRTALQLVAMIQGRFDRSSYDVLRDYWRERAVGPDFERFWQTTLHDGVMDGTASPALALQVKRDFTSDAAGPGEHRGLELVFRSDPTVGDGRWANNGWLQELPKPVTQLTWDNAAGVSPRTAERLGLQSEMVVELQLEGRSIRAPVWVVPGQADESVTVHLGYGRTRAGKLGTGIGFDAYRLRTSARPWFADGLVARPTAERYRLASTQAHHDMEGRHLVRYGSLADYRADPAFAQKLGHPPDGDRSLYPPWRYEGYSWGMAIDLNTCTGCGACVTACQAENNIPIVGKSQVLIGREMHWIRVDRYHHGPADSPAVLHQPMLCQHCENAPCEPVCPVAATVHGDEGLNEMVYNRCVGTRYCSNNCPYKVRRFNFLQYSDETTPVLKLLRNPDVTVRSRGVMEKCTYCVQRINAARIEAKKEDRTIRDGDLVTACEAACPAEAIAFGDLNDRQSRVSRLKADPRNYAVLSELETRPRTTYLARLSNPNPELKET